MKENVFLCQICHTRAEARRLPDAPLFNGSYYQRCTACRSIMLMPLPTREENLAFEGEQAAEEMAAADDQRTGLLARRLVLAGLPRKGRCRLLDVGCSAGRLMKLAREAGWEPTGIELSEALAAKARAHDPGAQVHVGDVMDLDLDSIGTFDVVIALDVIEHVLNPEEFLLRISTLLNDGGRLILHTPNAKGLRARMQGGRWNMLIPEYHFFLFSPEGLTGLLQRCGFEDIQVSTTSGTGLERGGAATLARVKEAALRLCGLGNALLITAGKSAKGKSAAL